MPELPEAETIARELDRRLAGRTLGRVVLSRRDIVHGDPRPLRKLLPGRRVERVRRRAKRVIFYLPARGGTSRSPTAKAMGHPIELVFHLGMSGRLTITSLDEPLEKHTHLRIEIRERGCELRFRDPRRFGGIWCFAGSDRYVGKKLCPLGLEPLDATPAAFRRILNRRRQIKALLLDQKVIGGLGNICCDESLHAAGIHPQTRANILEASQVHRLLRSIKSTLNRAIRFNGSTLMDYRQADGTKGSFQKHHRVYHREGKPCRKCGTPIERILAAGRSSFICPRCQPRTNAKTLKR